MVALRLPPGDDARIVLAALKCRAQADVSSAGIHRES
jgi:hypothetical protein